MIMKINWTYIACLSLTILIGCSGDDILLRTISGMPESKVDSW